MTQTAGGPLRVGALLAGCPRVELPAGSSLGADELPAAALFVVETGTVALVRSAAPAARRLVLALAGPREALLPPAQDDRLTAVVDARLTAVADDAYRRLLATPDGAATIADLLADAICDRERTLATLARFPHVERVRGKLLQLASSHGRVSESGVLIRLPLTHDLLADMVGSARETVTWAIRELLEEGFLSREGRLYRLHVPPDQIQDERRPAR